VVGACDLKSGCAAGDELVTAGAVGLTGFCAGGF
jgi:dienelactone hydrolase